MMTYVSRFCLFSSSPYLRLAARYATTASPKLVSRNATDQMDYIKISIEAKVIDWTVLKQNVLKLNGSLNQKNIDGVLLKAMISNKKIDTALLFADYLKNSQQVLNLGSINGLLHLYYELGKQSKLSDTDKAFILDTYNSLLEKYKILDATTGERLLHALCVIDEWKKALKLLDDIQLTCNPTHSAYSVIIGTLFKLGKKSEALNLIERSIKDRRSLKYCAYNAWINYVLSKYKNHKSKVQNLEDILIHIAKCCDVVEENTAEKILCTYEELGWNARFTKIKKQNGQCTSCNETLECLKLSEKEFTFLQQNVKEKLIVGSDLFLKTSPGELQRFMEFFESTKPYDIVLDALNIAYVVGTFNQDKMSLLIRVVDHFSEQNKKILLLGRKHMLKWPNMKYILRKTNNFFTENLSQDDPYFITAAILSGSHTDILSRDLLRGHRFLLRNDQLRMIFQRWQWQHQWMVFLNKNKGVVIQPPLSVTPCAQKKGNAWHLPYLKEDAVTLGQVRDGTPDWSSWLCLRPPQTR